MLGKSQKSSVELIRKKRVDNIQNQVIEKEYATSLLTLRNPILVLVYISPLPSTEHHQEEPNFNFPY